MQLCNFVSAYKFGSRPVYFTDVVNDSQQTTCKVYSAKGELHSITAQGTGDSAKEEAALRLLKRIQNYIPPLIPPKRKAICKPQTRKKGNTSTSNSRGRCQSLVDTHGASRRDVDSSSSQQPHAKRRKQCAARSRRSTTSKPVDVTETVKQDPTPNSNKTPNPRPYKTKRRTSEARLAAEKSKSTKSTSSSLVAGVKPRKLARIKPDPQQRSVHKSRTSAARLATEKSRSTKSTPSSAVARVKSRKRTRIKHGPQQQSVHESASTTSQRKKCHHCHMKTDESVSCSSSNTSDCREMYCRPCLKIHYGSLPHSARLIETWICPSCKNKCKCEPCIAKYTALSSFKLERDGSVAPMKVENLVSDDAEEHTGTTGQHTRTTGQHTRTTVHRTTGITSGAKKNISSGFYKEQSKKHRSAAPKNKATSLHTATKNNTQSRNPIQGDRYASSKSTKNKRKSLLPLAPRTTSSAMAISQNGEDRVRRKVPKNKPAMEIRYSDESDQEEDSWWEGFPRRSVRLAQTSAKNYDENNVKDIVEAPLDDANDDAPKDTTEDRLVKLIVVGCGDRGLTYSQFATENPTRLKIVAAADTNRNRCAAFAMKHCIPETRQFTSWRTLLKHGVKADAVLISTPDKHHKAPAVAFAKAGFHILLEKPMATTLEDCKAIDDACKDADIMLCVCHVLRYTPASIKIKDIVDSKVLGQIETIRHTEHIGDDHFAHSYVRGNWGVEAKSSFILLTKCCHDIDLMKYWFGPALVRASYGRLGIFDQKSKPTAAGKAKRCHKCKIQDSCQFSTKKIYIDPLKKGGKGWLRPVVDNADTVTVPELEDALKEGPYGRCVFECDNDVMCEQTAILDFPECDDATATIKMIANTKDQTKRSTEIIGSNGRLYYNDNNYTMSLHTYKPKPRSQTVKLSAQCPQNTALWTHKGGDYHLMNTFVKAVAKRDRSLIRTGPSDAYESHKIVFKADVKRKRGVDSSDTLRPCLNMW